MPAPRASDDAGAPAIPASTRRGFLRGSIAIVPVVAAGAGLGGCSRAQQAVAPLQAGASAAGAGQGGAGAYSPQFFNNTEWAFVQAAVARLIPADDVGPGGVEAGVPEFIDRQMEGPFGHGALWYMQGPFVDSPALFGYQGKLAPREQYRAGIAAVDAHCRAQFGGKRFAELDAAQQDTLLGALESGEVALEGITAAGFFSLLLQNTREGYLSDPIHGGNRDAGAWKMIGFPGARADFADWVGRREVYPLPPVTIAGPQG